MLIVDFYYNPFIISFYLIKFYIFTLLSTHAQDSNFMYFTKFHKERKYSKNIILFVSIENRRK